MSWGKRFYRKLLVISLFRRGRPTIHIRVLPPWNTHCAAVQSRRRYLRDSGSELLLD